MIKLLMKLNKKQNPMIKYRLLFMNWKFSYDQINNKNNKKWIINYKIYINYRISIHY